MGARFHHGVEAWLQETGKATVTGSWELTFFTINMKQREQTGRPGYKSQSPAYPSVTYFFQQGCTTNNSPKSTTNWESSVYVRHFFFKLPHSTYRTVMYSLLHDGSLRKWIKSLSKIRLVFSCLHISITWRTCSKSKKKTKEISDRVWQHTTAIPALTRRKIVSWKF